MMQPIVSTVVTVFPDFLIVQVMFGPLFVMLDCYKATMKHRVIEARYWLPAVVALLGIIAGIIVPDVAPKYLKFLNDNFTFSAGDSFVTFYISAWLFSYPTSALVQGGVYAYEKYNYGDSYYLTSKRAITLSKKTELSIEDLQAVFNYMRQKFRSGTVKIHGASENLEDVLDIFMYGEALPVRQQYEYHRGFYDAALLEANDHSILNNEQRMQALATLYQVTPQEIKDVLNYCVDRLREKRNLPGARPEDFAEIIRLILQGDSIQGHAMFVWQQYLMIQQHAELSQLQRNNNIYLAQMRQLQQERNSPAISGPLTIRREHSGQNAREALAVQLLERTQSDEQRRGMAVLAEPDPRVVSNVELAKIIEHFEQQVTCLSAALAQLPPVLPEHKLSPLKDALQLCLLEPRTAASTPSADSDPASQPVIFRPRAPLPLLRTPSPHSSLDPATPATPPPPPIQRGGYTSVTQLV